MIAESHKLSEEAFDWLLGEIETRQEIFFLTVNDLQEKRKIIEFWDRKLIKLYGKFRVRIVNIVNLVL